MVNYFPEHQEIIPFGITEESQGGQYSEVVQDILQEIHPYLRSPNRALIKELEEYVKRYPHVPQFKSHLYFALIRMDKERAAKRVAQKILKAHPDYLIGKVYASHVLIDEDDQEGFKALLGDSLWLHDLLPERDVFHRSELLNYYNCVCRKLAELGELVEAKKRLKVLIVTYPEDEITKEAALLISHAEILQNQHFQEEKDVTEFDLHAPNKTVGKYPQSLAPPNFIAAEQFGKLYEYGNDIPQNVLEDCVQLPRKTIVADCQTVLQDFIANVDRYLTEFTSGEREQDRCYFVEHSLKIATVLEITEVIPLILDIFRLGNEIFERWFDFEITRPTWGLLCLGFPVYRDDYTALLQERQVFSGGKTAITEAVLQYGLQGADQHEVAVQWFIDVYEYFLAHPTDTELLDTTVFTMGLVNAIDLRDKRFEPLVRAYYRNDWIPRRRIGTLEKNLELLAKPLRERGYPRRYLPTSIGDFYKVRNPKTEEEIQEYMAELYTTEGKDPLVEQYLLRISLASFSQPAPAPPVFNLSEEEEIDFTWNNTSPAVSQKVGRNDPCPCGSGKKYKKCCWNK